MEAVEKALPKAICGGSSLVHEPAKSEVADPKTLRDEYKASGLSFLGGLVENTRENGVRVAVNGKEVLDDHMDRGGVEVTKSKAAETEILSGNSFGAGKEVGLEDSEMNGVSSLLQMREHGERESSKGFCSLLGAVDKKEEMGMEKEVAVGGMCSANGVSLVVDICGEIENISREENKDIDEKTDRNGKFEEMSEGRDGQEEELDDEDYEFRVGDFVWGKIKNHPWWPGQIYDPSDASDFALKLKQKGRLLVAYFGDGTFAWCHPSQLKPFMENFEELSKISNSKNFINAIQEAVDAISRGLELMMTCSCVPTESLNGVSRPLAVNAGVKEGVLVPESGIQELSSSLFEPAKVVDGIKHLAQVVFVNNVLEFTMMKSQIAAFYRTKGAYLLPISYEPQPIPGLDDEDRSWSIDINDSFHSVEAPTQGPIEEDWLPSPVGLKFGQTSQSLLSGCSEVSEARQSQRRKQKSIAEIMEGDMNALARNKEEVVAKANTRPLSSGRKKRRGGAEANDDIDNLSTSAPRKRRKVSELSGSHVTATEINDPSVENGGGAMEESKAGPLSRGRKKSKEPSLENDGGGGQEETNTSLVNVVRKGPAGRRKKDKGSGSVHDGIGGKEEMDDSPVSTVRKKDDSGAKEQVEKVFLSRERKKSRYLSPPYTSLSTGHARLTKNIGQLIGSPPMLKFSGELFQKKLSRELSAEHETIDNSSPQTPKEDRNEVIDPSKVKAPANKVLAEVRSVACRPQYGNENNSIDMIEEFLSVFRSSIYRDGSNYIIYKKHQHTNQNQTARSSPEDRPPLGKVKKMQETRSEKPRLRQAHRASDGKTDDMETDGQASAAELFVAFGPGSSLPSKEDLIRIYDKYGPLDKLKTEMFYNNFCARIVFMRSSDAEEALNSSQTVSPFGASKVSFQLHYLSSPKKIRELTDIPNTKASVRKEGGKTLEKPSDSKSSGGEVSELNYIRQKLEMMTSMLAMSDGRMSKEMKSKLETEMKGLLEKVSTLVGSSS